MRLLIGGGYIFLLDRIPIHLFLCIFFRYFDTFDWGGRGPKCAEFPLTQTLGVGKNHVFDPLVSGRGGGAGKRNRVGSQSTPKVKFADRVVGRIVNVDDPSIQLPPHRISDVSFRTATLLQEVASGGC